MSRCRDLGIRALLMISALLAFASDTYARYSLKPSLRDYVHTAWTQHDGVPLGSVRSIVQTTDGYLWIVDSEEGLLRFDGVRFVPQPSPCGPDKRVTDAGSDGGAGLFLICDYQIFRRDSTGGTVLVKQTLLPDMPGPSMHFFVDSHRRLWRWGKVLQYIRPDGSEGPAIAGTERPPEATYCEFAEDSSGNIWFATERGLIRIRDDRGENVLTGWVLAVAPALFGGIYVILQNSIAHIGGEPVPSVETVTRQSNGSSGKLIVETPTVYGSEQGTEV